MIHGTTVTIVEKIKIGTDSFNRPIYDEILENVENVLIAPLSDEEILSSVNLTGKKAMYQLGIPKGDTHNWENKKVIFFGKTWRTIGKTLEGIESLIPLDWNKKVKVESIV